jgi:hypothetical protein
MYVLYTAPNGVDAAEAKKSDAYSKEMQAKMGTSLTYRCADGATYLRAVAICQLPLDFCTKNAQTYSCAPTTSGSGTYLQDTPVMCVLCVGQWVLYKNKDYNIFFHG